MLSQHKEVNNLKTKELHYFNNERNLRKGDKWYFNQFRCNSNTHASGEYTPNYLFCAVSEKERIESDIPENIPLQVRQYNEDIKLIVVLRNPIKRAISAYYHHISVGRISYKSRFRDVLHRYGIQSMGYYANHLEKWFQYFPEKNFLILILEEDLDKNNTLKTLRSVFSHIGVNPDFIPSNVEKQYNVSQSHFQLVLRNYLNSKLCKISAGITPQFIKKSPRWNINIPRDDIDMLEEVYKPYNYRLAKLLNRELAW